MAFVADHQAEALLALDKELSDCDEELSYYPFLLQEWIRRMTERVAATPLELSCAIVDPALALVGCRSDQFFSLATMYGGGTGMGCFQYEGVEVINFGPQHLPLGDCLGFGIEGGQVLLSKYLTSCASSKDGYLLEGVARMSSRPKSAKSAATYRLGDPAGVWLNTKMECRQEGGRQRLTIQVEIQGIFEKTPFAFVFFVKAKHCVVDGQIPVRARSFQHYQGKNCLAAFEGELKKVFVEAKDETGEMRVIPLGGGSNFWGADYLLAYECEINKKLSIDIYI
jgi:hypothetical protein